MTLHQYQPGDDFDVMRDAYLTPAQRRAYKQIEEDARAFRAHADKLSAILTKHAGEARDGERFRWMLAAWAKPADSMRPVLDAFQGGNDALIRAAIDAAMQSQPPKGGE